MIQIVVNSRTPNLISEIWLGFVSYDHEILGKKKFLINKR